MQHTEFINPEGLIKSPAFSQVVKISGSGHTLYVGGQNAVDRQGQLIGKNDLQAQTEQVMNNVRTALEAGGATVANVVKMGIYIVQGQNAVVAFQAAQSFLKDAPHPPAVTVLFVAGLVNPDFLLEVEATAFISRD